MKKVLILSGAYPYYGGEATTAYNLQKLLNVKGLGAKTIFVNDEIAPDIDPDQTGNSFQIKIATQNYLHQLVRIVKSRLGIYSPNTNYYLYSLRLIPHMLQFMLAKWYWPDIVVASHPIYYWMLRIILPHTPVLVIVGGNPEMMYYSDKNIDAMSLLNGVVPVDDIMKRSYDYNYKNMTVLFNSLLTKKMHKVFKVMPRQRDIQYFNIVPKIETRNRPINERKYDIAFVASNFERTIKNTGLAIDIFNKFSEKEKVVVGLNCMMFDGVENTEQKGLAHQKEVLEILGNTKLLIITSHFDASPGVLSEAIMCGCKVLVSKNVGWAEVLDRRCVVEDYSDLNEWKSKAAILLQHEIDYNTFREIVAQSEEKIIDWIKAAITRQHSF